MTIYVSHPSTIDYQAELYPWLREALPEHELILPHEEHALRFSKTLIEKSDLVIAEVSQPSTGQGIELGWANAAGVPIVAVRRNLAVPSPAIGLVVDEIHPYADQAEFTRVINELVAARS